MCTYFITLRDPTAHSWLSVSCPSWALVRNAGSQAPRPTYWRSPWSLGWKALDWCDAAEDSGAFYFLPSLCQPWLTSIFLGTSAVQPVLTAHLPPFPRCQGKRSRVPRGTQTVLWNQASRGHLSKENAAAPKHRSEALRNVSRVGDIPLSCSRHAEVTTLKATEDGGFGWHVHAHEIKYTDSWKVVELQT